MNFKKYFIENDPQFHITKARNLYAEKKYDEAFVEYCEALMLLPPQDESILQSELIYFKKDAPPLDGMTHNLYEEFTLHPDKWNQLLEVIEQFIKDKKMIKDAYRTKHTYKKWIKKL